MAYNNRKEEYSQFEFTRTSTLFDGDGFVTPFET